MPRSLQCPRGSWQDAALPIRFHHERASVETIVRAAVTRPIDGMLAVGDRPTSIAAGACEAGAAVAFTERSDDRAKQVADARAPERSGVARAWAARSTSPPIRASSSRSTSRASSTVAFRAAVG